MTSILSACYKGTVVVGSDSRSTCDGEIRRDSMAKMTVFPNCVVLDCGIATLSNVLQDMSVNEEFLAHEFNGLEDMSAVLAFGRSIFLELKERLESSATPDTAKQAMGEILVCTHNKIYVIDSFATCYEPKDFICTGSGGVYMRGYLEGVFDSIEGEEDLRREVRKALQIALRCDADSGGKLWVYKVEKASESKKDKEIFLV